MQSQARRAFGRLESGLADYAAAPDHGGPGR
jgi:hypothetical protein